VPVSTDIVLATLNAKYIHAAFGLRYLYANLGELQSRAVVREFNTNQDVLDIADELRQLSPRIIGLGVYIWNVTETEELVLLLKRILPDTVIVLGGPEVSFEIEAQRITHLADFVVTGEADLTLPTLCAAILSGHPPSERVIRSPVPKLEEVALPYDLYAADDVAKRIIYVEASRGCPFTCEFCLSSLDIPVRAFPLEPFLAHMDGLYRRGARTFKFVDRTFNLNIRTAKAILDFFWERYTPELFVHFEMVPDRLPAALRDSIKRFPPGALQFEVGIQTFNPEVSGHISRRQDYAKIEENLTFLRKETGVYIHADLIVGLPGENVASFAAGFDRLVALEPHEIQVGILKRLRGTPISRHDEAFQMVYAAHAPYEVLSTAHISFEELQRMRRFAKYWDLIANSGRFTETVRLLWRGGSSPFAAFMAFSDELFSRVGRRHGIALQNLTLELWRHLTTTREFRASEVAQSFYVDFARVGQVDYLPHEIRDAAKAPGPGSRATPRRRAAARQERHAAS
jgi:radical SAM superfamily enzyme YgiQ (UPF0313 family)